MRQRPLGPYRAVPDGGEHALDGIGRAQVVPVLGREVVERQQRVAVLDEAGDRLVILGAILVGERGHRGLGRGAIGRRPDLAQVGFGRGLDGLGHLVHDVDGFVDCAALAPGRWPDLLDCFPEAKCAIAGGQLGGDRQAARFQVNQQFAPALRAFAHAHLETEQLLLAFRRGPDQHQHALGLRLHARLQVDTVRPDINIPSGRQVALLPPRVIRLPLAPQPRNHRWRQVRDLLAQQRPERLLEIAHREAAQVEHRQHGIEAARAPRPARQDGRREADALGTSLVAAAVAQPDPLHRDRADAGLHRALRAVGRAAPGGRARPATARLSSRPGTPRLRPQRPGPAIGARLGAGWRSAGRRPARQADAGERRCYCLSWRIGSFGSLGRPSPASIRRLSQSVVTQFRP